MLSQDMPGFVFCFGHGVLMLIKHTRRVNLFEIFALQKKSHLGLKFPKQAQRFVLRPWVLKGYSWKNHDIG